MVDSPIVQLIRSCHCYCSKGKQRGPENKFPSAVKCCCFGYAIVVVRQVRRTNAGVGPLAITNSDSQKAFL